jgi:K+-sensing histidine kinase KdpD
MIRQLAPQQDRKKGLGLAGTEQSSGSSKVALRLAWILGAWQSSLMVQLPEDEVLPDKRRFRLREYVEVATVVAVLTLIAWSWPPGYRAFSYIYLLGVVALGLRVRSRGPVVFAAVLSATAWNFFTIPPRYTLRILGAEDIALFVTFLFVALVVSELTARIRAQGEQIGAAGERERQLAESERLHRALFDSVSHELNTPLTALRSAATMLRDKATGEQAELASEISQATFRMDRMVANLLDESRLESGVLKAQLDWCDARDLFNEAAVQTRDVLAGRNVTTEVAEDTPLLRADVPLMVQVLSNLLVNAAHHTPVAKPIALRAGIDAARNMAFLSVEDEGPGIPPDLIGRLFKHFQRGSMARAGGLGLGLSIAHRFVLAQGGEIMAENKASGGARFTVFLPIVPCEKVPDE